MEIRVPNGSLKLGNVASGDIETGNHLGTSRRGYHGLVKTIIEKPIKIRAEGIEVDKNSSS
jgi:hypothetical protein